MSGPHAPLQTAIAFQLSAALETYQEQLNAINDPWAQAEQYREVNSKFDEIRMLKGAMPELSVNMVEVLICHVELLRALWLSSSERGISDEGHEKLRAKHRQAVEAMRLRCLRVFTRQ